VLVTITPHQLIKLRIKLKGKLEGAASDLGPLLRLPIPLG
jgi:hypothetical protein